MNFYCKLKYKALTATKIFNKMRKISTVSEPHSTIKPFNYKHYNYEEVLRSIRGNNKTSAIFPFELFSDRGNLIFCEEKKEEIEKKKGSF